MLTKDLGSIDLTQLEPILETIPIDFQIEGSNGLLLILFLGWMKSQSQTFNDKIKFLQSEYLYADIEYKDKQTPDILDAQNRKIYLNLLVDLAQNVSSQIQRGELFNEPIRVILQQLKQDPQLINIIVSVMKNLALDLLTTNKFNFGYIQQGTEDAIIKKSFSANLNPEIIKILVEFLQISVQIFRQNGTTTTFSNAFFYPESCSEQVKQINKQFPTLLLSLFYNNKYYLLLDENYLHSFQMMDKLLEQKIQLFKSLYGEAAINKEKLYYQEQQNYINSPQFQYLLNQYQLCINQKYPVLLKKYQEQIKILKQKPSPIIQPVFDITYFQKKLEEKVTDKLYKQFQKQEVNQKEKDMELQFYKEKYQQIIISQPQDQQQQQLPVQEPIHIDSQPQPDYTEQLSKIQDQINKNAKQVQNYYQGELNEVKKKIEESEVLLTQKETLNNNLLQENDALKMQQQIQAQQISELEKKNHTLDQQQQDIQTQQINKFVENYNELQDSLKIIQDQNKEIEPKLKQQVTEVIKKQEEIKKQVQLQKEELVKKISEIKIPNAISTHVPDNFEKIPFQIDDIIKPMNSGLSELKQKEDNIMQQFVPINEQLANQKAFLKMFETSINSNISKLFAEQNMYLKIQFSAITGKIDKLDTKLDTLDQKVDTILSQINDYTQLLEQIKSTFDNIQLLLQDLSTKLENIPQLFESVGLIQNMLTTIKEILEKLQKQIERVPQTDNLPIPNPAIPEEFIQQIQTINQKIQDVLKTVQSVSSEKIQQQLNVLEKNQNKLYPDIQNIVEKITEVQAMTKSLADQQKLLAEKPTQNVSIDHTKDSLKTDKDLGSSSNQKDPIDRKETNEAPTISSMEQKIIPDKQLTRNQLQSSKTQDVSSRETGQKELHTDKQKLPETQFQYLDDKKQIIGQQSNQQQQPHRQQYSSTQHQTNTTQVQQIGQKTFAQFHNSSYQNKNATPPSSNIQTKHYGTSNQQPRGQQIVSNTSPLGVPGYNINDDEKKIQNKGQTGQFNMSNYQLEQQKNFSELDKPSYDLSKYQQGVPKLMQYEQEILKLREKQSQKPSNNYEQIQSQQKQSGSQIYTNVFKFDKYNKKQ